MDDFELPSGLVSTLHAHLEHSNAPPWAYERGALDVLTIELADDLGKRITEWASSSTVPKSKKRKRQEVFKRELGQLNAILRDHIDRLTGFGMLRSTDSSRRVLRAQAVAFAKIQVSELQIVGAADLRGRRDDWRLHAEDFEAQLESQRSTVVHMIGTSAAGQLHTGEIRPPLQAIDFGLKTMAGLILETIPLYRFKWRVVDTVLHYHDNTKLLVPLKEPTARKPWTERSSFLYAQLARPNLELASNLAHLYALVLAAERGDLTEEKVALFRTEDHLGDRKRIEKAWKADGFLSKGHRPAPAKLVELKDRIRKAVDESVVPDPNS